jgi:hypothetical protein
VAPKSLTSQSGPSKPDNAAICVLAFDHARQRSMRTSRRPMANDGDDSGSSWPRNGDPRLDEDDRLLTAPMLAARWNKTPNEWRCWRYRGEDHPLFNCRSGASPIALATSGASKRSARSPQPSRR